MGEIVDLFAEPEPSEVWAATVTLEIVQMTEHEDGSVEYGVRREASAHPDLPWHVVQMAIANAAAMPMACDCEECGEDPDTDEEWVVDE